MALPATISFGQAEPISSEALNSPMIAKMPRATGMPVDEMGGMGGGPSFTRQPSTGNAHSFEAPQPVKVRQMSSGGRSCLGAAASQGAPKPAAGGRGGGARPAGGSGKQPRQRGGKDPRSMAARGARGTEGMQEGFPNPLGPAAASGGAPSFPWSGGAGAAAGGDQSLQIPSMEFDGFTPCRRPSGWGPWGWAAAARR